MGMSAGHSDRGLNDINVTPLVDVMLVLLIIFMVTAPMLNQGVNIDLPDQVSAPPPDKIDSVTLSISKDLAVALRIGDGKPEGVDLAALQARLHQIALTSPDAPVFLEAHASVPYRRVAFLLAQAQAAGLVHIGMVFEPTGDAP